MLRKTGTPLFSPGRMALPISAAVFVLLAACSDSGQPAATHYDILIVNGTVYSGAPVPARQTSIGIDGDHIVSMDAAIDATADRTIDASGQVVVPGFIDPHTHAGADLADAERSLNLNYLAQGVTTVFIGSDGGGVDDRDATINLLRAQGIGTNTAFFAGHGGIREKVMGLENRAPSETELRQMLELTAEEMRAGAVGLSTGLYYTPGSFSTTDEVVALARVAAQYGGVYDTHMRDESAYSIGLIASVEETITIAEEARIPVHISHLKALGREVWGQSGDVIALITAARERGLDVTANQYPYQASGTRFSATLIPGWVRADSVDAMFARLENSDLKDRIREEMQTNLWRRGGPEAMLVTGAKSEWRGMTLADIAMKMERDSLDAAIEVVRGGDPSIASFVMKLPDIQAIALQDWVMTGSDGSEGHPRKYATYPKAYRDMVVDAGLFSLQRFVYRSAGLVADTFNLCDRGYLRAGRKADVVIIDLDNYLPLANFENPTALASGVRHVLVNGVAVISDGEPTGVLPGVVVDRQNLGCN